MATIDRVNFGFFDVGRSESDLGRASTPDDIASEYAFSIGGAPSNINIGMFHLDRENNGDGDMRIFRDVNRNGRLDVNLGEPVVASNIRRNGVNESINVSLSSGHYIIGVVNNRADAPQGRFIFRLNMNRVAIGNPNGIASREFEVGNISADLTRRNQVSANDTADNFAFSLDAGESLGIKIRELGNKRGEINARVVQDLNRNGLVDKNEVVVRSTGSGNLDTISNISGAGDYILQVCQVKGNVRFEAAFDHSAA